MSKNSLEKTDISKLIRDGAVIRLAPEVAHHRPYWSWVGGASGAALGFIVGNMPGAVAGAVAGNRLGAVRDAKGKSVAEVFTSLDHGAKAEVGSFRWLSSQWQHEWVLI